MTENKSEILNPKTDWVFKLMFSKGEEGNKALISFLNAFLKETYGTIQKADILNTELIRESPKGETYHLDLLVKTDNALIVNIEMQQFWKNSIPRRNQLYLARAVSHFLKKEPNDDDFLYAIGLTVFGCDVPQKAKLPLMSEDSVMQFIYVALNELIGYTMSKDIADYTAKDFWIRFLSNYAEDKESGMLKKLCALEEGLEMAEATLFKVTEEERRIAWELSTQHYYDILADERAEGREEGEAIGLEKGIHQKALETAKNLLDMNFPIGTISKATGLSEAEITQL
ncbi:MAG: PD-(D/E)XK nuclease family transposase [Treponema sp.]|uniref:PD-(D/E)XK nuclease family transposase n=1 Tax=Treponema sp. TaxID=166 RepID=UPI003FA20977